MGAGRPTEQNILISGTNATLAEGRDPEEIDGNRLAQSAQNGNA